MIDVPVLVDVITFMHYTPYSMHFEVSVAINSITTSSNEHFVFDCAQSIPYPPQGYW